MNIKKFKEVIARRNHVEEISHGEWADGIEECCKNEITLLTEDVQATIDYLKNECTADEFTWISEVLDDIVELTGSKEILLCYRGLMDKFPEECEKYNIAGSIESAEAILKWGGEHGKKE